MLCISRREALRRWQTKQGLRATYGNLLELFVNAGHTQCAEAVCEVLRKKCESRVNNSIIITTILFNVYCRSG